jgi:hypothetical protein
VEWFSVFSFLFFVFHSGGHAGRHNPKHKRGRLGDGGKQKQDTINRIIIDDVAHFPLYEGLPVRRQGTAGGAGCPKSQAGAWGHRLSPLGGNATP